MELKRNKELLIEKETPKKVILDYDSKYEIIDYHCPNCSRLLGDEWYDDCRKWDYCAFCGQRLEWEKVSE